ncbi:hypothetical protein INS49_012020 [Diaporthe citri]|uniref:uncharacterized protein n=1 Tax=Diaporthe citri TaxID=83186 RepID=UPI001C80DD75|nr:uncharacterized protein INS49_012020 [Diaporthe citri]KAG6360952.1 hypothetical protein INS49_012020 [Diaporthe citri]
MSVNEYGDEARERVVDETLSLIDHLGVEQARSILRCFAIDEENFDAHALVTVEKTVRATCDRSQCDYDATIHFPDLKTARLNRAHLLKSRAMSAKTENATQQAAEHAQRSAEPSQASVNIPNMDNRASTDGHHDPQEDAAAETSMHDTSDLEFERLQTRRLIRDGHVTINHYYMNKSPEVQPEPERKPEQKPEPTPDPKPEPKPQPKPQPKLQPKPQPKAEPEPEWLLCDLCDEWYLEEDNVLQEDGRPPCGYHPGQIINYANNELRTLRNYGFRMTGRAWNCCRRRPDAAGCHPEFHEPADSGESE